MDKLSTYTICDTLNNLYHEGRFKVFLDGKEITVENALAGSKKGVGTIDLYLIDDSDVDEVESFEILLEKVNELVDCIDELRKQVRGE